MTIVLNGEPVHLEGSVTVGQLVDDRARDRRGVAVAIDGEVVPRAVWDETPIDDGAKVELVGAVQGG